MSKILLNRGLAKATVLFWIICTLLFSGVGSVLGQSVVRLDITQIGFFNFQQLRLWPLGKGELWVGGKNFMPTLRRTDETASPYFNGIPSLLPLGNTLSGVWKDSTGTTWLAAKWLPAMTIPSFGFANGGILKVTNPSLPSGFTLFNSLQNVPMISVTEPEWFLAIPEGAGGKVWLSSVLGLRRLTLNNLKSNLFPAESLPVSGPFEEGKALKNGIYFKNNVAQWLQISTGPSFKKVSSLSWFGLPEKTKIADLEITYEGDTLAALDTTGLGNAFFLILKKNGMIQFLGADSISLVSSQQDGKIWVSGLIKGLFVLENGMKKSINPLKNEKVREIKIDSAHVKWVLTDSGKVFQINDLTALISSPDSTILLCDSSTWKFKDGSTSTGQGITSWLWDFGDGQSSSERNPRHRYEQEGSYKITLTVKDKNGSSASTNNEIWVTGALYLKINPPARTQSCHAIQLSGYANHGFSWTFPNGIKDTSFEITATQSGWYKAEAQNIACLNRDSIRLTISSDPQNVELIVSDFSGKEINSDLIGFPPVKVKGSLASGSDACHGNWYLNGLPIGDSLTQIFNIEKAGFYRMEWKGINSDSCQRIGIKEFNILEPSIPNLVTANVDGHNDSFKIEGTIINELSIFNRWGKEIFNVKPYQNDWPPSDLQDGTYFYRLKAGETIYQGWVEVVR